MAKSKTTISFKDLAKHYNATIPKIRKTMLELGIINPDSSPTEAWKDSAEKKDLPEDRFGKGFMWLWKQATVMPALETYGLKAANEYEIQARVKNWYNVTRPFELIIDQVVLKNAGKEESEISEKTQREMFTLQRIAEEGISLEGLGGSIRGAVEKASLFFKTLEKEHKKSWNQEKDSEAVTAAKNEILRFFTSQRCPKPMLKEIEEHFVLTK